MKYVEKYNPKEDVKGSETKAYNAFGQAVSNEDELVYAEYKSINLGERIQKKFFVLTSNGNLFDPRGTDSHRTSTIRKDLRSTSKQTFDYYVKYLQTKNNLYMRRAERSYING